MNNYPQLKGNHIIVRYMPLAVSTAYMVLEHYDTDKFDNTVFIINTIDTIDDVIKLYPNKNYIYYQMEHLNANTTYSTETIDRLSNFPCIWDIDINNVKILNKYLNNEIYFMPVRYTSYFSDKYIGTAEDPKFDLLFYGVISPERMNLMNEFSYDFETNRTCVFWGNSIFDVPELVKNCKFVMNLHQVDYEHSNQEQVRIFELLSIGKSVISAKSKINYFGDLIKECDPFEIHKKFRLYTQSDNSEKYKQLTYSDESYENYKQDLLLKYS